MRSAPLSILLALGGAVAACQTPPPVRVATPTKGLFREIQDAVGIGALFQESKGLTYAGVRVYPGADNGNGEAVVDIERPLSLSLRPSGAFLLSVGTEEAAAAHGFDGRTAWSLTPRGISRELALGARAHQLSDGWLRTLLWLTPGDERFSITQLPSEPGHLVGNGVPTVELKLQRVGEPIEAALRVNAETMRPMSYAITRNERTRTVAFDDWQLTDGVWFPHEMTESVDGELVHTDRFTRRTLGTPRSFARPRSLPLDTTFAASGPIITNERVPARVDHGGRFYVQCKIDEHDDAWMLLDTGFGSHAIHAPLAETLGVSTAQAARLQGVGGGGTGQWAQASTLTVGPFTQSSPRLVTVDTTFLSSRAGFEVAGIIGAPLFERAVVVLDEPRAQVSIYDPQSYWRPGLAWLPLAQDGSAPCLEGRLVQGRQRTRPLWFRMDTGSDDTVTIAEWASKEFKLVGDRANLRATRIEGAFGTVLGWRQAIGQFDLGLQPGIGSTGTEEPALRLRNPEVTLLRDGGAGPLSDPWIAGNLGTRALRGCRIVLDLTGRRIAIESDRTN